MKIIKILALCFVGFTSFSSAQTPAAAPTRYWIQFTDKNNSPYSLTNPGAFLSARSLQRRLSHGIPIVQTDIPVNQNYIDSLVAKGAHIHCRSKWFNGVVVNVNNPAVLAAIQTLPFVVQSIPIGAVPHPGSSVNSDKWNPVPQQNIRKTVPAPPQQTSLNYGSSLNQINMLQGVCLHDQGFQGQGMVIALLDAGFAHADTLHAYDSLRANHQILGTWDFVTEKDSVYNQHFHGEMVLSCMGANLPGQLIGTAPKAQFWLLVTEDVASEHVVEEYNWAAGAEYADSVGADVINTSLGYTTFDDSTENHTYQDMNGHTTPCARAANYAANKGIAVVCAEGNLGGTLWNYVGTPADADSVLAVGAVDGAGSYASFSSHGPAVGGMVKPAVDAEGQGTIVADFQSNSVFPENGTSFASPVMCGLVACLWQAHPQVSNMELFHFIEQSASQFNKPDTLLGYGKPDFCAANLAMGVSNLPALDNDFLSAVRPNPFADSFDFIFWSKNTQQITVNLFDLTGRKIRTEQRHVSPLSFNSFHYQDLTALSSGIYFLSIHSGNEVFVRKLMKE
jgi:serine protease AprX